MKRVLNAFAMCHSMFCSIPSPFHIWDESARPLMLVFLPLIGAEIGLLWAGAALLCRLLALPQLVTGFILCAFPYLLSGFIHLDGFLDVTDAVHSYRDLPERRRILKDSRVGAFAVIGCVLLLLGGFAAHASADVSPIILIFIPIVSRCCSALAVMLLRPMSESQYAGAFNANVSRIQPIIVGAMLAVSVLLGFLLCGKLGFSLLGGIAGALLALWQAVRSLEGMNGDISGYALTLSELAAAFVLVLM